MSLKHPSLTVKFIVPVFVLTALLMAGIAAVVLFAATRATDRQTVRFLQILDQDQTREEEILGKALRMKAESLASLLVRGGGALMGTFDYDALGRLARDGAKDSDIVFVAFYNEQDQRIAGAENRDAADEVIRREIRVGDTAAGSVVIGLDHRMLEKNRAELTERRNDLIAETRQTEAAVRNEQIVLIIIVATAGILLLCVMIYLCLRMLVIRPVRRINDELRRESDQVLDASEAVSSTSQFLAESSSEQAAAIEETAASLEEIASMGRATTALSVDMDALMHQNLAKSAQSLKSLVALTRRMTQIEKDSDQISHIIKAIDEIAFQTNLLALNAAIEAARAGEAGSGFGVVADEVRSLAIRATEAAQNTQELLAGIIQRVVQSSRSIREINDDFGGIIRSATTMGEKTGAITHTSAEQATGIEQVNKAVSEMDQLSQGTAANAEESSAASEELRALAERMGNIVANLNRIVSGDGHRRRNEEKEQSLPVPVEPSSDFDDVLPVEKEKESRRKQEIRPDEIIPLDEDFRDF